MAVKTKNIANLENQLNARWPGRDKSSDGWLGDTAHQDSVSGHNPDDTPGSKPSWDGDSDTKQEVRARDIDVDFRDESVTPQEVVDHLRALPGFDKVCRYLIYSRKLYHSRNGFDPEPYYGSNPHDKHIHYEGAWSDAADENGSFDFKLEEVGTVALSDDDINRIHTKFMTTKYKAYGVPLTDAGVPPEYTGQSLMEWTDGRVARAVNQIKEDNDVTQTAVQALSAKLDALVTPEPLDYDKLARAILRVANENGEN